jgi:hypothetical protein
MANTVPSHTSSSTVPVGENTPITTAVYTATAMDPDANTTLTYSLSGMDAGLLDIDSSTGAVTFRVSPNFEDPDDDDGDNVSNITVIASNSNLSVSKDVEITVQ